MSDVPLGPHAPETGWPRRVLGPLHFSGVLWYRLHLFLARLPDPLLAPLTRFGSLVSYVALANVRRAVGANLTLVHGPMSAWTRSWRAYRTMHVFAWCLTERYRQFVPGKRPRLVVENPERYVEARALGRGLVLATSHVGNWEAGSTAPLDQDGEARVHVVREAELDPRAQTFVAELLDELGGAKYETHFAGADQRLGVELLGALRRGEIVALQVDRPRAGGKTLPVHLFGSDYDLPHGPVALARVSGAPLLPAFTFREGRGCYRIVFREPVLVARTADRDADHRAAALELARSIEWAIRAAPEQWFCFRDITRGRRRGA